MKALLSAASSDLARDGAVNVICWHPGWHPLSARLRTLGFRERKARNYLIVYRNQSAGLELEHLTEDRHWYYTRGDSDYHMRRA